MLGNGILCPALIGMASPLPRQTFSPRTVTRRKPSEPGSSNGPVASREAVRARRKFLGAFPGAFRDETYLDWERDYKWNAHQRWSTELGRADFERLIKGKEFEYIATAATRIESRTNLLFSFEKMALRDAVRSPMGAKAFALALFEFLHGTEPMKMRFDNWVDAVAKLTDMAARDGFRLHRSTECPFLLETHGDAGSSAEIWRGIALCIPSFLATV